MTNVIGERKPSRKILEELNLDSSWVDALSDILHEDYMYALGVNIANQRKQYLVHPQKHKVFKAFKNTPFSDVNVVLVGQDPYHSSVGQLEVATGLCFESGVENFVPPSLRNIHKELISDLELYTPNLNSWSKQGVLMMNTALTVIHEHPESHIQYWMEFTEGIFRALAKKKDVIYVLWGRKSQMYKMFINPNENFILEAAHPSPFSANSGFFGCKHFSKINEILKINGKKTINW
jgi:uracil-DNA glycosylase